MKRIVLHEYDKRNREMLLEHLEKIGFIFISIMAGENIDQIIDETSHDIKGYVFDVTPFFRDEEKAQSYSLIVEKIIDNMVEGWPLFFIIDRRYTFIFEDVLFYRIKDTINFEKAVGMTLPPNMDIVSIDEVSFNNVLEQINKRLIGNKLFKQRLGQELRKYRIFNKLGYQPIFSLLICGNSGIGKTEVARILAQTLSPNEPFIKINFGNYSDQNALSSLIGSPRGYIGSNKGELSDKLLNSRSKVILIDEFEKSDKQVQNFFLQLLEDGMFTDSLGRDYNLDKYIIVFTANLAKEKIPAIISPELSSRFNLKFSFSLLNAVDKKLYIENKTSSMLLDIETELGVKLDDIAVSEIKNIEVNNYDNMRDINAELMRRISEKVYPIIYE